MLSTMWAKTNNKILTTLIADNIRAADFTRIFKTAHKAARRRKMYMYNCICD